MANDFPNYSDDSMWLLYSLAEISQRTADDPVASVN